ncbi:type II toxin-antitoxin system RelE family toxin [Arthrobacter sp. Sr24]
MAGVNYSIRFTPQAQKAVRKLDPVVGKRIRRFLEERLAVAENPRSMGKKLVNEDFWRYRVGDYRILVTIDDEQILVLLVDVAHRRDVYTDL